MEIVSAEQYPFWNTLSVKGHDFTAFLIEMMSLNEGGMWFGMEQ
jgi:hypothetical protein